MGSSPGIEQDDAIAAGLFQKACSTGDADGCSHLGDLYKKGAGVERSAIGLTMAIRTPSDRTRAEKDLDQAGAMVHYKSCRSAAAMRETQHGRRLVGLLDQAAAGRRSIPLTTQPRVLSSVHYA